ncbi:hypothetical protein BV25DRAFT_1192854 [Artomyces pyxidatus]|uniref:Uncharacterized protein n=1 Tax=Artomyces pyxidatus TaxID=48021 RepID=A0ACB8SSN8_9AGAM|nr:hypothetical protein BV25DRAFT_1192854 [Artomyces pyxidatus]
MPRTDSVDPTTLALPSPSASPSPSPSTSSLPPIAAITNAGPSKRSSHSIVENAPPRKRSRTELTPEERKEARAHRNRIAAQNSRDKRKAQFATLEARISELTAENRALREGMGLAALRESAEQKAAEDARERENRELRERVKTLESGWDAIVKALQTHGLPSGIPSITVPKSDEKQASSSTTPSSPDTQSTSSDATSSRITTAFPVLVPSTPVFPLSPSPTLSYASASPSPYDEHEYEQHESTRHLARVASVVAPSTAPQQRVDFLSSISTSTWRASKASSNLMRRHPTARLLQRMSMSKSWTTSSARFSRLRLCCPPLRFHLRTRRRH